MDFANFALKLSYKMPKHFAPKYQPANMVVVLRINATKPNVINPTLPISERKASAVKVMPDMSPETANYPLEE